MTEEVCPNNLAPTTSTTAAIAIGDALAVALIKARDFKPQDFARFHPGGSLGRRLLTRVKDVMQKNDLPFVGRSTSVNDVILTMTNSRSGMALVVDDNNKLSGVITDGDLRRYMTSHESLHGLLASDLMCVEPVCISQDLKLGDAEQAMKEAHIKCLVVTDDNGNVVGLVDWAA